jgi:hypothetical protein
MCAATDGKRFIYFLASAVSFWRFDTWSNGWQQLASPNAGGTFGVATSLEYDPTMGVQSSGQIWGSVYLFMSSSGAPGFHRYDIGTNTWSAALSVAALPGTWGTSSRIVRPNHRDNNWESGITGESTVTASAPAIIGATSISVSATSEIMPSGTILNFGTAAAPKYAVLTALASAGATSLTVSPLLAQVNGADTAYYYNALWLWGNNSQIGYRYNVSANAWSSQTIAGAVIAIPPAVPGVEGQTDYLPGITPNTIGMIRGSTTSAIYLYNLSTNAFTTTTILQGATQTWGVGSTFAPFKIPGQTKRSAFIGNQNATLAHYATDPVAGVIVPWFPQNQFAYGTASSQDRVVVVESPDDPGVQNFYEWGTGNTFFWRSTILTNPFTGIA